MRGGSSRARSRRQCPLVWIGVASEVRNRMRLESYDGSSVHFSPQRYQFGPSSKPRDWDANWLVITGDVDMSDGRSWSFTDPCLTTWEARELASWFRGVLSGDVQPAPFGGEEDERLLVFTEPNLAFSLAGRERERLTIRVHFSLESRPPWLREDVASDLFDYYIEVSPTKPGLVRAVDEWERELAAFPVR